MVGESYGGHLLHVLSIFALGLERKACHLFILTSPWGKALTFSHGSEAVVLVMADHVNSTHSLRVSSASCNTLNLNNFCVFKH